MTLEEEQLLRAYYEVKVKAICEQLRQPTKVEVRRDSSSSSGSSRVGQPTSMDCNSSTLWVCLLATGVGVCAGSKRSCTGEPDRCINHHLRQTATQNEHMPCNQIQGHLRISNAPLPRLCCLQSTALQYVKRFYTRHSCLEYDPARIVTTAIYLACKVGPAAPASSNRGAASCSLQPQLQQAGSSTADRQTGAESAAECEHSNMEDPSGAAVSWGGLQGSDRQ